MGVFLACVCICVPVMCVLVSLEARGEHASSWPGVSYGGYQELNSSPLKEQ